MRAFACGEVNFKLSFRLAIVLFTVISAQCPEKSWKLDEKTQQKMDEVCKEEVLKFKKPDTKFAKFLL